MNVNHRAVSAAGVAVKRVLLGAFAALLIYFFCTPMGGAAPGGFPLGAGNRHFLADPEHV